MEDRTLTVLLVEDHPHDIRLIREALTEAAARGPAVPAVRLVEADRLATGLARLAEGGIDAVLLDLTLPDSRGMETFLAVHAHAPNVPLVVLTGLDDESMGLDAIREGAQDYLVKGGLDGALLKRSLLYAVERRRLNEERERALRELRDALAQIKVLQGILPICSHCKKIRDEHGRWLPVEQYIRDRSEADFSHGICPACLEKHYRSPDRPT